jgi:hypothetical protein
MRSHSSKANASGKARSTVVITQNRETERAITEALSSAPFQESSNKKAYQA